MDKNYIRTVWEKYLEVQEKKKAPVTDKDDDGEGMDPVGKADGDIDNDGDKDSSDEYLANRRKKIGKEIKKEGSEESPYPSLDKKKREKKGSNLEDAGGPAAKLKGESVEEGKEECPKCEGEGCDHCDGKGYHSAKKETYGKKMKESNLFSADELAAIEEKMGPGATGGAPEKMGQTASAGEKKFADDHKKSDSKFETMQTKSTEDAKKAGHSGKQSPARRGDNLSNGDTKVKG